uniref:Tektin n=1 Tax=Strigamia maritima TaxID=126957 RepID=T1IK61_STRMM
MESCVSSSVKPLPLWSPRPVQRVEPIRRLSPYTGASPCFDQVQRDPNYLAYRTPDTQTYMPTLTRYTPAEWSKNMQDQWQTAENARNISERLRTEALHLVRQTNDQTRINSLESGQRLGERMNDVNFWMHEVKSEVDRLDQEMLALHDVRRHLERALNETNKPLHIAQECLLHREKRRGIDLVHDEPEESLVKEVDLDTEVQSKMRNMLDKINVQYGQMRMTQHEMEKDLSRKMAALDLDNICHQLNKHSPGIGHFRGIERMEQNISTPETYPSKSNENLVNSQSMRLASARLRAETETLITNCAHDMWISWTNTNTSLQQRSKEGSTARDKLHMHLARVNTEINELKKHIALIVRSITDKASPLQVAQTRLEVRTHRPNDELCNDGAHERLVKEVDVIQSDLERLHRKLQDSEEALQSLVRTRAQLEDDLRCKANSVFIDRDQCLGLRKSFPYNVNIVFC